MVWSDGSVAWRKQVGEGGIQMVVPPPSLHYKHAQTVHLSKVALRSLNRTIRKCKKEPKKGRLFFLWIPLMGKANTWDRRD